MVTLLFPLRQLAFSQLGVFHSGSKLYKNKELKNYYYAIIIYYYYTSIDEVGILGELWNGNGPVVKKETQCIVTDSRCTKCNQGENILWKNINFISFSFSLSLSLFPLPYCADISLELHECVRDEQVVFLLLAAAQDHHQRGTSTHTSVWKIMAVSCIHTCTCMWRDIHAINSGNV